MKKRITTLVFMLLLSMIAGEAYSQFRGFRSRGRVEKYTSLGLRVGTLGLGFDLEKSIGAKSSLRLEGSMFSYAYQSQEKVQTMYVDALLDANVTSLSLYYNFFPMKSRRNKRNPLRNAFHLTAGVSYRLTNDIKATVKNEGDITVNETVVFTEEETTNSVDVVLSDIAPYIGLGYDIGLKDIMTSRKYRRMFTRNAFMKGLGFSVDLGMFYHGSPEFDNVVTSDAIADADTQLEIVGENVKGYQFYPNLSFSVRYRFSKGRSVRF